MSKPVIYPTHKCFDDALGLLEELAKMRHPAIQDGTLILVHGICTHPEDGSLYAHAWVEDRQHGYGIWKGILQGKAEYFAADLKEFRDSLGITEQTEYTPLQAVAENHRTGTYGPWIEKYLSLCRNSHA